MNDEAKEKYLQNMLSEFAAKMKEVAEDVIGSVETEYLPHVLSDTECNVAYRTADCIQSILLGRFEVAGEHIVVNGVHVWLTNYDRLATEIYTKAQKQVDNLTIKELESKVRNLESQLKEAYSYRY